MYNIQIKRSDLTFSVRRVQNAININHTGKRGVAGPAGATGAQGPQGEPGTDGTDGVGVPEGGTNGQILAKASNDDFDTEWIDQGTGDVTDAQNINVLGVGLFSSKQGSILEFKGIAPDSDKVTVTDDGSNQVARIDVVPEAIFNEMTTDNLDEGATNRYLTDTIENDLKPRVGVGPSHYGNVPFSYYDNFLTGWSDYYARGTITTDTSVFIEGESSLKIVTNTPVATGEWCGVSKTVSMDLSKQAFRLYLYSPDWSKVGGVNVGISTSGDFVTNYNIGINGGSTPADGEWIELTFTRSRFTRVGLANWATANAILVRAQAVVGQQATVYMSGFATVPMVSGGVCSITFDDGFETDYLAAKPYLDKFAFKATSFIVQDRIGLTGRLTEQQIKELHRDGWDISNHSYSHPNLTTIDPADLPDQVRPVKEYLVEHGYRGADIFAYPQSATNYDVKDVVMQYHSYARSVSAHGQPRTYVIPMTLMATDVSSVTLLATVQAQIDAAVADGEWLILVFHRVINGGGAADVTPAFFEDVVDYIAASGLPVKTLSQVLEESVVQGDAIVGSAGQDATTTTKGVVKLANDLGGTADLPTVVATHLSAALPIDQGGTGSTSQNFVDLTTTQNVAGTKNFTTKLTAGSVGDPQGGNLLDVESTLGVLRKTADANGPVINMYKRGATGDATAALAVATAMFSVNGYGWHGTGYTRQADIDFSTTEAWSSTNRGTRIEIFVTPNGSITRTQAVRIDQDSSFAVYGTLKPNATGTRDFGQSNLRWNIGYINNLIQALASKTANYTLVAADSVIVGDTTSGGFTLTLPTAVSAAGRMYTIVKSVAANTLSIATTSSQTINGAAAVPLTSIGSITVVSDGANWQIVSQNRFVFSSTEGVFNENGENIDFRIEGDTDANLFVTDASADFIGIGKNNPAHKLDVLGSVYIDGADGDILLGASAFPNRAAATDSGGIGLASQLATKRGIITELDGLLFSLGINVEQLGDRDTTRSGILFRLDTRLSSESATTGNHDAFVVKSQAIGGSVETNEMIIDVSTHHTYLNPASGRTMIGSSTVPHSNLQVTGSFASTTRTITGNRTLDITDNVIFANTTSGGFTVTLPTAVSIAGREYTVIKTSASNTLTIATTSSQTVNGAAPVAQTALGSVTYISDGANWWIK